LKDGAVHDIVRRRARMTDQPLGKLSAHSLRPGFVTEAGNGESPWARPWP
jgi:hypothetical protein